MDHFPKPPNKTDEELRQVAAILTMIATAITRMADTAPGTSKSEGQNKKTMGASAPAPNGLPEHEILTVAEVAKYLRISKSQAYALTPEVKFRLSTLDNLPACAVKTYSSG
jgi:hypothetical protein